MKLRQLFKRKEEGKEQETDEGLSRKKKVSQEKKETKEEIKEKPLQEKVAQTPPLQKEVPSSEEEEIIAGIKRLKFEEDPQKFYHHFLSYIEQFLNQLCKEEKKSIEPLKKIVGCITENFLIIPELLGCVHGVHLSAEKYLSVHAINVCFLSLYFGFVLGYERNKLVDLGVAALIHDLGMSLVPREIYLKNGKLTNEEIKVMQRHVRDAAELLNKIEGTNKDIIAGVLYHHEREAGTGYPNGHKNGEIHEFGRLIGICDTYESMTHPRLHREPFPPADAIKKILTSNGTLFAQNLLQILTDHIGLYPVGSLVQLSTGEIGRVKKTHRNFPSRPEIEICLDQNKKKPEERQRINLLEEPSIFIQKVLVEKELKEKFAEEEKK